MDKEKFELLLKEASLSKKEFAKLVDMNYKSVVNWNTSENVPLWVESWLENYIKAKKFDDLVEIIMPYFLDNLKK